MDDDDNLRLNLLNFHSTSAIFTMCTLQQSYTERMTKRRVVFYVKRGIGSGSPVQCGT